MKILKESILSKSYTSRGGSIEIDLSYYGYPQDTKMLAYQNYLGGDMLGNVGSDCNISRDWKKDKKLAKLSISLKKYYANQIGSNLEDFEGRPFRAY